MNKTQELFCLPAETARETDSQILSDLLGLKADRIREAIADHCRS